jgi:Transposase
MLPYTPRRFPSRFPVSLQPANRSVVACVLITCPDGALRREVRTFSTMTADLLLFADWLETQRVQVIALESIGVFWKPVFNLLEDGRTIVLVNPQHIKAVPGRKTDVKESEWLADLLRHGLLTPSFIPPAPIRELRKLTRYRKHQEGNEVRRSRQAVHQHAGPGRKLPGRGLPCLCQPGGGGLPRPRALLAPGVDRRRGATGGGQRSRGRRLCHQTPARPCDARARAQQARAAWVTADSVYGDDRRLRIWLEAQEQAYVLAVSGKEYVNVAATWTQRRVSALLAEVAQQPAAAWQRLSAGEGAKGPRLDDWLRLPLVPPLQEGYERWFLVRRSRSDPADLQGYVAFAPAGATLEQLVRVAGSRGTIEVAFEAAKGEVGLDQYEVRSYHGWYRHITLALFAQAPLTRIRHRLSGAPTPRGRRQAPDQPPREKGPPQRAVLRSRPRRRTRRGRRGSMAAFRRQRQAQQGRYTPQPAGGASTPSSS